MEAKIDWQFGAKGASGRAHFERGQDAFVIFDGEEIGRIPTAELEAILRENIRPAGRANRLVERVQSIMQVKSTARMSHLDVVDFRLGLRRTRWVEKNRWRRYSGTFTPPTVKDEVALIAIRAALDFVGELSPKPFGKNATKARRTRKECEKRHYFAITSTCARQALKIEAKWLCRCRLEICHCGATRPYPASKRNGRIECRTLCDRYSKALNLRVKKAYFAPMGAG